MSINWTLVQISNEGVKLMLKNSSTRELEEYKDKVSKLGASFGEKQDMQGATFAYALYKMTEHVQVEEIENLQASSCQHFMSCFSVRLHGERHMCPLCHQAALHVVCFE